MLDFGNHAIFLISWLSLRWRMLNVRLGSEGRAKMLARKVCAGHAGAGGERGGADVEGVR